MDAAITAVFLSLTQNKEEGRSWWEEEGGEEGGSWGRQRPIWVRSGRTTAKAGAAVPRLPREGGGEMKRGCKKKNPERKQKEEEAAGIKYTEASDESADRK